MLMERMTSTIPLPPFYLERWEYQEEVPLGDYGCEILLLMQREYTDRYWQLVFEGSLVRRIRERERELLDLKMIIMEELHSKFPRPRTKDFLEIAAHMSLIDEEAEKVVKAQLRYPV